MTAQVTAPQGRYLVLGATGLVGTHALELLNNAPGIQVRAVYHKRKPFIQAPNIEYAQADLTDAHALPPLFKDADYVMMFAGVVSPPPVMSKNPIDPAMQTLRMTMHCLEAAYHAGVKKFLWLSSTAGYPSAEGKLKEEQMFQGDPPDVYFSIGWMTRYLEVLCRLYSEKLKQKMTTIVLRPSMIYGEHGNFDPETAHFLPVTIRRVIEKQNPLKISGKGDETRDFIYVKDVVEACFLALGKTERYDVFNVASGRSYTINELLDLIKTIGGQPNAEVLRTEPRPQSQIHRSFDNRKAADKLGFTARTSLEDGLRKTIDWCKKEVCHV